MNTRHERAGVHCISPPPPGKQLQAACARVTLDQREAHKRATGPRCPDAQKPSASRSELGPARAAQSTGM
eukprot:6123358-Prymnesium_polylepis.2